MPSKRASSALFSAIEQLDVDDNVAAKKRKKVARNSVSKSKAARSQNELFTSLMEARIMLQRAIFASKSTMDEKENYSQIKKSSNKLFENMIEARSELCPDINEDDGDDDDDDDEERMLQSSYDSCREQWKEVLNKRHSDLQLHSGLAIKAAKKFQTIDQSFWSQVTSAVSHDRIMSEANNNEDDQSSSPADESPSESFSLVNNLFQDDKLYQHMLKDFINTTASANGDDGASHRLLKAMKKSKKNSKQVDRKASKGRKIRYTVHPKLINFTFPIQREIPFISEDDWFKSLFGGSYNRKERKGLGL